MHERSVTRQTCLAEVLRLFCVSISGQDTRQVAAPIASVARPSLAACAKKFAEGAPLFHVWQPQPTPWPPACHQLLQLLHLHNSHILGFSSLSNLVPPLPSQEANPTGRHLSELHRGSPFHWPLSSESGERSLCSVSCLASYIIVVCSFDGTCTLPHNANL